MRGNAGEQARVTPPELLADALTPWTVDVSRQRSLVGENPRSRGQPVDERGRDHGEFTAGRTTINGEPGSQPQNLRVGGTLALPINRYNSIKLYASTGAYTRVGGNFTTAGIAWQFRWGGGL